MSNMINDNEDPTEMEYELEDSTAFEVGTTTDPNPSKKKKKTKTPKARGLTFSTIEDILLVKAWFRHNDGSNMRQQAKGEHILDEHLEGVSRAKGVCGVIRLHRIYNF